METTSYDFSGWVTRNDLTCGDGRVIRKDAFAHNDGKRVPLVWNHQHDNPSMVVGYIDLENRPDGVYGYGCCNDTASGSDARAAVRHGDVRSLSIYANRLQQRGNEVLHGEIREVSLVLAGANPGAYIDFVMEHSDDSDISEFFACYDEPVIVHSDAKTEDSEDESDGEETVGDVLDSLNEKQRRVVNGLLARVMAEKGASNDDDNNTDEGENDVKHNVFEEEEFDNGGAIMHSEIVQNAIEDARKFGSMKESFIAHAEASGIGNYELLLPEPHTLNNPPEFIKKDESWVSKVIGGVKHTPFSRVKSQFAYLDETEARARGYIKGNMKKDLALSVLKRTTTPTTVYIKMKMDRDDTIDITDFSVVEWIRGELRGQLDKEIARAMLLGDGRPMSSDDKIDETAIRPIISDDAMYTIKYTITDGVDYNVANNSASANDSLAKGLIRGAIKARKDYKGSGNPTFFTTEEWLTELLLIEDQNGRRLYNSESEVATAMRVKEIVTIPEMELAIYSDMYGVIVNMNDYTCGADKGGAVATFDDFDINYNQLLYLTETRCSGALTRPYSAIVLLKETD